MVVRNGSQFVASANAVFSNCGGIEEIGVSYAHRRAARLGTTTLSSPFSAVLGQDTVSFDAECGIGVGAPIESVIIQVVPAQ